ncbi:hypothetical protein HanPI659440_Chr16g0619341 [Helianthus annuus]|nr:hypothetical protein HanPI659440_Chr16g0619341 [Helianthus annuus]
MRSTGVESFRRSFTTNGGNGGNGKSTVNLEKAFVPSNRRILGLGTNFIVDFHDRLFYGYVARPVIKRIEPDEIVIEMPAQGATTDQIKMFVDEENIFVLEGSNQGESYTRYLALPVDANFEKAVFKPVKLKLGLVEVTITNFKRKQVEVKFTEECGDD